jgi:hypothetical protein
MKIYCQARHCHEICMACINWAYKLMIGTQRCVDNTTKVHIIFNDSVLNKLLVVSVFFFFFFSVNLPYSMIINSEHKALTSEDKMQINIAQSYEITQV